MPEYDPWAVYGFPVAPWPGWYWYPGLYWTSPGFAFGIGFDIGFFGGYGWGWHHWGHDWHHNTIVYNHNTYISRSSQLSSTATTTQPFARGYSFHGSDGRIPRRKCISRGGPRPHMPQLQGAARMVVSVDPMVRVLRGEINTVRSVDTTEAELRRGYSSRGSPSMGGSHGGGGFGGGGFHGGGGGFHGGGGRR